MSSQKFSIKIKKEALKFSSAHMTVYADGSKERLHGHDYQVELEIDFEDASLKSMIPFSVLKSTINELCGKWDEKFLLAKNCVFYKEIERSSTQLRFKLCEKEYSIPVDEIEELECDNISAESLSLLFANAFYKSTEALLKKHRVSRFRIFINEGPGQGASYTIFTEGFE